jgi:hypothetical protein
MENMEIGGRNHASHSGVQVKATKGREGWRTKGKNKESPLKKRYAKTVHQTIAARINKAKQSRDKI